MEQAKENRPKLCVKASEQSGSITFPIKALYCALTRHCSQILTLYCNCSCEKLHNRNISILIPLLSNRNKTKSFWYLQCMHQLTGMYINGRKMPMEGTKAFISTLLLCISTVIFTLFWPDPYISLIVIKSDKMDFTPEVYPERVISVFPGVFENIKVKISWTILW